MSPHLIHRASFLIRIWRESQAFDAEQPGIWRAHVEHVQSGESRYVDDLEALIGFLEQWTGTLQSNSLDHDTHRGERFHET